VPASRKRIERQLALRSKGRWGGAQTTIGLTKILLLEGKSCNAHNSEGGASRSASKESRLGREGAQDDLLFGTASDKGEPLGSGGRRVEGGEKKERRFKIVGVTP